MQQLARSRHAPAPTSTCQSVPSIRVLVRGNVGRDGQFHRTQLVCRTASVVTTGATPTVATTTDSAVTPEPAAAPAPTSSSEDARTIVDQVLEAVKDTDSGMAMSPAQRAHVDSLLGRLEAVGQTQKPRPLANPLLWGNYNVAYTSPGPQQDRGEPAGGRFRGRLGRALFRTAGLFQSVLQPDIATNKVEFRLLGVLPGHVGLRGRVLPQGDSGDTVQVLFEPPVLGVADKVFLRIGGFSTVTLATTYLDERVRLGKGSRGSLFVFTRGGAAEAAGMDQIGVQRTSFAAAAAFTAFFASLFLGGAALWLSGLSGPAGLAAKGVAVAMWMLGTAVAAVARRGGLMMDRDEERLAAQLKAEMERRQQQEQDGQGQQQGTSGEEGTNGGVAAPAPAAA